MAVFNSERTLPLALRSIIWQTCPHWELILIDDGSSDGTLHIARQFADPRIRMVADGQHLGLSRRLNQAVAASRGTYFARMDGDDIAYPERLERQIAYLQAHPAVDLVGSQVLVFGEDGRPLGKPHIPETHAEICARAFLDVLPLRHPTFLGSRAWFRRHRYDDEAIKTQDQILLLRSYRSSTYANVPEILLGYREEQLDLRKMLLTRYFVLPFMLRELLRHGQPGLALRASLRQMIKGLVEVLAVGSGLKYGLLGHRLGQMSLAEQQRWQAIWQRANQEPRRA